MFDSSKSLLEIYSNGFNATLFNQDEIDKILSEMPNPLFGDDNVLEGSGKGQLALGHKLVQKYDPTFGEDERQETGDCTSHGLRNATTNTLVSDIEVRNEPEGYVKRLATETIYGTRGHRGQGMSVAVGAKFLASFGIALRQKYGKYDLSRYNPRLGINWGGIGVPREITDVTKNNTVQRVSLVRSIEEARDLIYNGYGLAIGSNFGFSSKRDAKGISNPSGSWLHCMSSTSMDDTGQRDSETLFLILNSWGAWNSGPRVLDQPKGSFWIRSNVMARMISQGQTWAISNVNGFPARKIDWSKLDAVL